MIRQVSYSILLACLVMKLASCAGAGAPPPPVNVGSVVGIAANCTASAAAPLLAAELAKVTSALSQGDYAQVEAQLQAVVADLVRGGLGLEVAWQATACLVQHATADGFRDASRDQLADLRGRNGQRWITVHQVVYTSGVPPAGDVAPAGATP